MKKIIDMFFSGKNSPDSELESCVAAAVGYAGLELTGVTVDEARFVEDAVGRWCAVSFRESGDSPFACGMGYTAYVDAASGEVVGFSGESDVIWDLGGETVFAAA